jgi:hypothetical protein
MSRLGKQLAYGFFFLALLALLGALIYYVYVRPEPGCFNGRQDRGEEGVDCGGPCAAACIPEGLLSLEMLGEPRIFRSSPALAGVLVRIQNPNLEVAAKSFNYRIDLYDAAGAVIASRSGSSFIYAGEIRYIADFINVANSNDAFRAVMTAESRDWLPAARYPSPNISIQEKRTEIRDNSLVASGRFLNQDVADFPRVEVIAVFYSSFGLPVGITRTEVENVKIGESRTFTLFHPFSSSIDPAGTEYFVYARRP